MIHVLQHVQHQHAQVLRHRPQGGHVRAMRVRTLMACQVQLLQVPVLSMSFCQQSMCMTMPALSAVRLQAPSMERQLYITGASSWVCRSQ